MQKQQNFRMTRQRGIILEELRKTDSHPSADEIYEIVRKRLPRISLGTVYRNLEILTELKQIQKLEIGGSLKRFDGNPKKHYHIRCIGCGRVVDAPIAPLINTGSEIHTATDYKIIGHRFEFVGLCPACSETAIAPGLEKSRYLQPTCHPSVDGRYHSEKPLPKKWKREKQNESFTKRKT